MQALPDKPKVGLVTDWMTWIDDGTFNQYAYEGLRRAAEEQAIEIEAIQNETPADYESSIQQLIERGCGFVVTLGPTSGVAVERLALRHPAVRFIIVDYEPLEESRNVTGLVFAEDQAGFLAGPTC